MNDSEHKLVEQVAAGRLIFANEQIIFPLLARKEAEVIGTIVGDFAASGEIKISNVAKLTAYRNIIEELKLMARQGERAHALLDKGE